MNTILTFWAAHKSTIEAIAVILLPSIITGLSSKPTPATNAVVTLLKLLLDRLSFVTHADAAGSLKLPIVQGSKPLGDTDGSGTGAGTAAVVAMLLALGAPGAAHAQAMPAPASGAAPSPAPGAAPPLPTPSGCVPSRFGGCIGPWVAYAPEVIVIPVALNLRTRTLEGGAQPGLCYGASIHKEAPWGFGGAVCGSLDVGTQTARLSFMASFFDGWLHLGWGRGWTGDSNATAPRLLLAIGSSL